MQKQEILNSPYTKRFGMPDHPPIAWLKKNNRYYQCGGDACDPTLATCWGWCGRPNKTQGGSGAPIAAQGDIFDSGGGGKPTCDVFESGGKPSRTPPDVFESGGTPGRTPSGIPDRTPGRFPSNPPDPNKRPSGTPDRTPGHFPSIPPSTCLAEQGSKTPPWTLADYADYTRGVADGLRDCFSGSMVVAGLMARFDFKGAADAMGLKTGQSVLLQEFSNTKVIGQDVKPYDAGAIGGRRFCSYGLIPGALKAGSPRAPLAGRGGKISVPPGYDFEKVFKGMPKWIKDINGNCRINCGPATANWVRGMFGKAIQAAATIAWAEADMEAAMGKKFMSPLTKDAMGRYLTKLPNGTVGVLSGENPKPGVRPKKVTCPTKEYNPGHFTGFIKIFDRLEFWDGQSGGPQVDMPDGWLYRTMIVGNGYEP